LQIMQRDHVGSATVTPLGGASAGVGVTTHRSGGRI
jgi:hypothetical protein